jgi:predicted outer membrane repeat protein
MYNDVYSSPAVANCTFSGNTAQGSGSYYGNGGGMYNSGSSTVTNCTFSGNTAATSGGGMYNSGSPTVTNCIFGDNTAPLGDEVYKGSGTPTFRHCDIKGSGGSGALWNPALGTDGGGNIMGDPRFVAPATPAGPDGLWRTSDDGLRLQSDSPCIGAADPALAPGTDILGLPRTPPPDIGAYEFASGGGSCTLTYNAGAGGSISGTTPQTVASGADGAQVTAVPNTGYRFVRWSDDVMTASRTDTNVTADITVTAIFAHSRPAAVQDWALYE